MVIHHTGKNQALRRPQAFVAGAATDAARNRGGQPGRSRRPSSGTWKRCADRLTLEPVIVGQRRWDAGVVVRGGAGGGAGKPMGLSPSAAECGRYRKA